MVAHCFASCRLLHMVLILHLRAPVMYAIEDGNHIRSISFMYANKSIASNADETETCGLLFSIYPHNQVCPLESIVRSKGLIVRA